MLAGKKDNYRKSGDAARNKQRKQEEAVGRQNIYDSLSPIQKIERIESRRGESAKERNKLLALLA